MTAVWCLIVALVVCVCVLAYALDSANRRTEYLDGLVSRVEGKFDRLLTLRSEQLLCCVADVRLCRDRLDAAEARLASLGRDHEAHHGFCARGRAELSLASAALHQAADRVSGAADGTA